MDIIGKFMCAEEAARSCDVHGDDDKPTILHFSRIRVIVKTGHVYKAIRRGWLKL